MKRPKEIKKGLECCIGDNHEYHCDLFPYNTGEELVGCVDEGLSLYEDVRALIQQLEAQVPRWISVEERLPDEGEKVIVRGVRDGIQTGTYKGHSTSGKNVWWWAHNTYLKVSCWMPKSMLPEAPKEEEKEHRHYTECLQSGLFPDCQCLTCARDYGHTEGEHGCCIVRHKRCSKECASYVKEDAHAAD